MSTKKKIRDIIALYLKDGTLVQKQANMPHGPEFATESRVSSITFNVDGLSLVNAKFTLNGRVTHREQSGFDVKIEGQDNNEPGVFIYSDEVTSVFYNDSLPVEASEEEMTHEDELSTT